VNDPIHPASPRRVALRRAAFAVVALLVIGIAWALWTSPGRNGASSTKTSRSSTGALDVYADTPFENARPGVAYVGDAACIRCHREIALAYQSHPMGRSLAPVEGTGEGPPTTAATGLPFEYRGLHYTVERREGRVFQKATRRDAAGNVLAETVAEVRFALGSGRRGTAFLIERDGFLFQAPIAWFGQKGRWDIAPGLGEGNSYPSFERPIQPECLFCHTNQLRHVAQTLNRYEPPIFEGHAIGCERCHGPGELHVKGGGRSTEPDWTIVNPAKLAPTLRDSVCQQCHLQGLYRFPRAGRDFFDFRPGLPLHRFLAVFVQKNGNQDKLDVAGQVEQLESSRCFRASQGQLGCTHCHDPHRLPEPSIKAAYYRSRCLECHEKKGCALPLAERQARGRDEDCIACHMPRSNTTITHVAVTDHRIRSGAAGAGAPRENRRDAPPAPGEVVPQEYHWALMTEEERRDAARDLGVALEKVAHGARGDAELTRIAATQALPLLEAAVRDRPDDLSAGDSLGYVLGVLRGPGDALGAFERILRIQPGREWTLSYSALALRGLKRFDLARAELQKTIAVSPWRSDYRLGLARVCSQAGDWAGAVAACRDAIRLDPELVEARSLLVQCYLQSHEPDRADAEFQVLLRFYPASREAWQQWYEQEKRAGRARAGSPSSGEP
jgi:predicted CXXCH cytochrome family protein